MGRRKICRRVAGSPAAAMYKPAGAPLRSLAWGVLPVEGLEALRLVDAEGLGQEEAAERMGVSRPTLNRILGAARAVVARALANGWALRIEGGNWVLADVPDLGADSGMDQGDQVHGPEAVDAATAVPVAGPGARPFGRGRCGQGRSGSGGRGGRGGRGAGRP